MKNLEHIVERVAQSYLADGLWDNIRKKRERGESPAKPGDPDYPDEATWNRLTAADKKFTPPKAAQNAAKKAIKWREEHGDEVKAMTQTGWTRARQLADGDALSYDIVKRMANFNRHRKNSTIAPEHKNEPWKDNGYVAWLGWGGDTGVDWAMNVVEREEAKKASRGNQTRRKDKDLMQDTGGISKGRDREPHVKPPRDDVKERYRDRRLTPDQQDKDTNENKDRPVKKPCRRPQGSEVHPLDRVQEGAWLGMDLPEDNYHRRVKSALHHIMESEMTVSEKDFSGQDWLLAETDRIIRLPQTEAVIRRFDGRNLRPNYCAECIFANLKIEEE